MTTAYLIFSHWGVLTGHLLSDSLSHIYSCYLWSEKGIFAQRSVEIFLESSNSGTADMYRPLGILSFCTDFLLWGEHPAFHKLIQLLWHLTNGVVMFLLLKKLNPSSQNHALFSLVATVLFMVSPTSPEVSAWVATRFDSMVQLFMLISLYGFWKKQWLMASLFFVLALISKESAMVLAPFYVLLAAYRYAAVDKDLRLAVKSCLPAIAILSVYLIFRSFLFGASLQVYELESNLISRTWENFINMPGLFYHLVFGSNELTYLRMLYMVIFLGLVLMSLAICFKNRLLKAWLLCFVACLTVIFAISTQVSEVDQSGSGSRILYIMWPTLMCLLSLPILLEKRGHYIYISGMLVFCCLSLFFHWQAVQEWGRGSQVSRNLIASISKQPEQKNDPNWGLVWVPEHIGVALLARNAQGAIVFPPFQETNRLNQLVPFVAKDADQWFQRVNEHFSKTFKTDVEFPEKYPNQLFSTNKSGDMVALSFKPSIFSSIERWREFWQVSIAENDCYS